MKVLKIAAIVVGTVALVATGFGAAGVGILGMSAGTLTTVGAIAGAVGGLLSLGASLLAPKPSFGGEGNPVGFQTNPQSGLPYAIGRTGTGSLKVAGKTANSRGWAKDDLLYFVALLCCAPIQSVQAFTADNVTIAFDGSGQATTTGYSSWMSQAVSLGDDPQASALAVTLNGVAMPGWTSAHKLSGMAHVQWSLRYDTDAKHYEGGVPDPLWVIQGAKVYDPRLDSTYPGGSGSCRWDDESTHVWSRNPALNALKWARGHYSNGKKVCGIGAPKANIRVADFVEAANVADANGWGCGGVEYTTDSKWDILTRMLQAGGAVPTMTGAMIGCRVQTPRTSIATISGSELLDGLDYAACKPRRSRINSVLPRYRSEAHRWEIVTGEAVTVDDYVTEDGALRSAGLDLPLVQAEVGQAGYDGELQAGQLAAYHICQSREAGPIEFTTGLKYIGVYSGDCVTLDAPDEGFALVKLMITGRSVDIATATIRFTAETETDGKHAFALGTSSAAPAAPSLTAPPEPISVVPTGTNQATNSEFAIDDRGWFGLEVTSWPGASGSDWDYGRNYAGGFGGNPINLLYQGFDYTGLTPPSDKYAFGPCQRGFVGDLADLQRYALPVSEGERVFARALMALYGGTEGHLRINFMDADGVELSGTEADSAETIGDARLGGPVPNPAIVENLAQCTVFADAPAGAAFAVLGTWGRPVPGGAFDNFYIFLGQPLLAKIPAGQVVGPAYHPGPADRAADVTGESADYLALLAEVTAIGSDGVLSKGEKPALGLQWTALYENWLALDAKATAISLGGSYQSNASTSVSALSTYLSGLSPAWTDATADTAIVAATFESKWADAYTDVAALQAAIQGIQGDPGENGFTISPSSVSLNVPCTIGGTPVSGALPLSRTFKVLQGTTDLSDDADTDYSVSASGISAAMGGTNSKVLTLSAPMTADQASATVTVQRFGVTIAQVLVTLDKAKAAAAGLSAQTTTVSVPSGTSYGAANAGPIGILSGNDGTIRFDAYLLYNSGSASNTVVTGKLQYSTSTDGVSWGSWTDVATEEAGTDGNNVDAGELALTPTLSHTGTPLWYRCQLLLKRNGVTTTSIGGNVNMWWEP